MYAIYILNGQDCGNGKYYIELHIDGYGVVKGQCLLSNLPKALKRYDIVMGELIHTAQGIRIIDRMGTSRRA